MIYRETRFLLFRWSILIFEPSVFIGRYFLLRKGTAGCLDWRMLSFQEENIYSACSLLMQSTNIPERHPTHLKSWMLHCLCSFPSLLWNCSQGGIFTPVLLSAHSFGNFLPCESWSYWCHGYFLHSDRLNDMLWECHLHRWPVKHNAGSRLSFHLQRQCLPAASRIVFLNSKVQEHDVPGTAER